MTPPCRCAEAISLRITIAALHRLLNTKEDQLCEARAEVALLEQQMQRARPRLWAS